MKKFLFIVFTISLFINTLNSQEVEKKTIDPSSTQNNEYSKVKTVKTSQGEKKQLELTTMVKGDASLYYSKDKQKGIVFYAQKSDGDIYEINKDHYIGFLNVFFSDCKRELFNDMKKDDVFYDKLTLSSLFSEYNKCMGNESFIPKSSYPKFIHGVKAGINVSDISNYPFNIFYEIDLERKVSLTGGYFAEIAFSKMFAFYSELVYVQKGAFNNDSLVDFVSHDIQLPLFLKVTFLDGKIKPYILAGPKLNFQIDETATRVYATDFIPTYLDINEQFFNFGGGIGASIEITKKNLLFFEMRFDCIKFNSKEYNELKNMNMAFMAGISF